MKSLFISFIVGLGSLFGLTSHPATLTTQAQSTVSTTTLQSSSSVISSSSQSQPMLMIPASTTSTVSVKTLPTSTPIPPQDLQESQLVITYPTQSDVLIPGYTYDITWKNEGPTPINFSANLEYIFAGIYIRDMIIGTSSSQTGKMAFIIPPNTLPRTNYQIYLFDAANGRVLAGSNAFTIK